MFSKRLRIFGLVMALTSGVGCANSQPSDNTPAPETAPAKAEPAPEQEAASEDTKATESKTGEIPEGSKFACHLNCSGTESTAYGSTEEEARANVRKFVEKTCRPEDGQYFIVCDPLKK